jgi:signal peptidase I
MISPDYISTEQPKPSTPIKEHIIELFQTLVIFATIAIIIYWLIAQPHKVSGASMFPNFKDGDFIITDKLTYKFGEPKRGDVVVFKNPRDESEDFIKRIMGLPGDRIKVENGHVYINGKMVNEGFLKSDVITPGGSFMHEGQEIVVQPGEYIAMGDNRQHSSDSREWGFVTKKEIIGRVFLRYWPANQFGLWPAAYSLEKI